MSTITTSSTVPTSITGAGRQSPTPIHIRSPKTAHIDVADDLKGLSGLQAVGAIETPASTSSVPVPVPVPVLHRVRTINRLEGLAILEKRKAYLAREDFIVTFPLTDRAQAPLRRVRTVNKLEGLSILARRKALHAERTSGNSFLSTDTGDALSATANKENCERRKAPIVERQSVPTYFVPEYPNHLSTPPPLVRRTNVEDFDVSEDARIAYAMWVKDREARFAGEYSVATQSKASLARVTTIGKREGCSILERRRARFAKGSAADRSQASSTSLVRVRAINKKAGLEERKRRKGCAVERLSIPTYFVPDCPALLSTPPPLARMVNKEGSDVSEDARITFYMWVRHREACFAREYPMAARSKASPTQAGVFRKRGVRRMNSFDVFSLFKKFADVLERVF